MENTNGIIELILRQWNDRCKAVTSLLQDNDASFFQQEVAPGKNRVIYIAGHLVASNDGLLPLFGIGEKMYPALATLFLASPDRAHALLPQPGELLADWEHINKVLDENFNAMTTEAWLDRHMSVSAADFLKEPHRNKLNVLLSRIQHISFHLGQVKLIRRMQV